MTDNDCQWVQQSIRGSTEAFRLLVERYANAVFAAAYAVLGNAHDAEDVAQDAFVKAWYNLARLQDHRKFGSWLVRITRNAATDYVRARRPAEAFEEAVLDGGAANFTEEAFLRRDRQRAVWRALGELDEKYRIVMTQYYIGGYNAKEIGMLYGIRLSAVESRLRRAKTILKKEQGANAIVQLGEGGPSVLMHEEKEPTPLHFMRNGKPAPIFELRTDDAEAFYAQLLEQGATVSNRHDNLPCGKYFHVHDPDGNVITIVE